MSDVLKRLGVAECSEPGELAADRAEARLAGGDDASVYREVWERGRDAGYAEGVVAAQLGFAEPPPERAILTDLIAELRGQADIWQEGDINEGRWDYPAMMLRAHADRAEALLREVTGDE